jgi:hypothetical protein
MGSPEDLHSYFGQLVGVFKGIPPTHFFNYDESPLKDDPGAEDLFCDCKQRTTAKHIFQ